MWTKIMSKLKFKVYDKEKKKLYNSICGLGIDERDGEIILVDLHCDANVSDWKEIGERYELRAYLNGKKINI
jgi:hypothetical protein